MEKKKKKTRLVSVCGGRNQRILLRNSTGNKAVVFPSEYFNRSPLNVLLGLVLAAAEVCSRRLGCPHPAWAAPGALSATECHAGRCKNPTGLQRNGQVSTKCFAGAGPEPPAPRGLEPGTVPRSSQRAPLVCEAPHEPVPCPRVDPSAKKQPPQVLGVARC